MEVIASLPLIAAPFVLPFISGIMAKSFGRKFWPWFFIGIPLPLIANVILLCLPDKAKKETATLNTTPVENNHVFDHLFIDKDETEFPTAA